MYQANRRQLLRGAASAAAWALLPRGLRAAGANNRVRVAVIGAGNQGSRHAEALASLADVQIAAVCDVDPQRRGAVQESSGAPGVGDLRRILDDPSVDAVTIATPDHWHVPAALLALAAGKHVYVEKPCSHNVREGRWLVDAARRSGRVVAHGTQSRSSPGMQEAIALLRDGIIGEVLLARCWNYQLRESIGRRQPSDPPAGVDYDQWVGPALWMPYQENRFHYHWHWWHNFGTGDVGNDGCHELDLALWGLGVERLPSVVAAAGGKFFFEDDQQWPDTAQITLQWERPAGRPLMLIYEQRLWTTNYPHGVDGGVEFFGVGGRMFLSKRGKFEVLGERNRPLDVRLEHPVEARLDENLRDWLDAIRENRTPQASIEIAHRTATAAHLGNIALRTGRSLRVDADGETIVDDAEAAALLGRTYRDGGYWATPAAG